MNLERLINNCFWKKRISIRFRDRVSAGLDSVANREKRRKRDEKSVVLDAGKRDNEFAIIAAQLLIFLARFLRSWCQTIRFKHQHHHSSLFLWFLSFSSYSFNNLSKIRGIFSLDPLENALPIAFSIAENSVRANETCIFTQTQKLS